jgi:hypothetical protein
MREPPVELAAKTLSTKLLSCAQRPAAWTVVASVETKLDARYSIPICSLTGVVIDLPEMAMSRSTDLFLPIFSEACCGKFRMLRVTTLMRLEMLIAGEVSRK